MSNYPASSSKSASCQTPTGSVTSSSAQRTARSSSTSAALRICRACSQQATARTFHTNRSSFQWEAAQRLHSARSTTSSEAISLFWCNKDKRTAEEIFLFAVLFVFKRNGRCPLRRTLTASLRANACEADALVPRAPAPVRQYQRLSGFPGWTGCGQVKAQHRALASTLPIVPTNWHRRCGRAPPSHAPPRIGQCSPDV